MSVPGAPSAKEKKYDRQLRLWAANGQEALENAHVCLINATAAGTEILKNLVLPGIGKYTIIDDAVVSEVDLGVNFFLNEDSLGHSRAQKACKLLQELNPDATGAYINDNIANLLLKKPDTLSSFTLVLITGDLPSSVILSIDKALYPLSIPLLVVKSIGFITYCRLVLAEHTIIESHPDSIVDLRLLQPFDSLLALAKEKTENLDNKELMSNHDHGHIPYVLILLKYLEIWKKEHDGKAPQNYSEKNQFKSLVRSGIRNATDDENYEEAIGAVLMNFNPSVIPSATKEIFEDDKCVHLTPASKSFWIIARAISLFTADNGGLLPLPGALPDMKAQSKDYIQLQNIYKAKAREDLAGVMGHVKTISTSLQKEESLIKEEDVDIFCKHAGFAKLVRGRSLEQEYGEDVKVKTISNNISDKESLIHYYLAIRAYENHLTKASSAPGTEESSVEADKTSMASFVTDLLKPLNVKFDEKAKTATENAIAEIVRAGGGELHNISSLAGGLVAQEIIKVITRQYVVMNNTVIFDGITSRSEVFQL